MSRPPLLAGPLRRIQVTEQIDVYVSDVGRLVIRQGDWGDLVHFDLEPRDIQLLTDALTNLSPIAAAKRAAVEVWQEAEYRAAQATGRS